MDQLDHPSDEEFLTHCYRYFLGRDPDIEGKRHHLAALAAGLPRATLLQRFAASEEFIMRFNAGGSSFNESAARKFVPDGHFYSPIPAADDYALKFESLALDEIGEEAANEAQQLELAAVFREYYRELPFTEEASSQRRYYLNNGRFNYFDGIVLYSFIRLLKPRRIIEVGSGFSSAAMIDTCELFVEGKTDITFIEPYPATLYECLREGDKERHTVVQNKVQDVPLDCFQALERNDILFIDSSHVSKFGSDVNHLLFKVLPVLQDGVVIHFHDIFRNFDYPLEWLKEGRAWNESYLIKAFLSCNEKYRILFFNDWFASRHWEYLEKYMPLCTVQPEGSPFKNCGVSLWVVKGQADLDAGLHT